MNIEDYDLELEKVIKAINEQKKVFESKKEIEDKTEVNNNVKIKNKIKFRVCIQLPEGLKPYANKISKKLIKEDVDVIIWAGSHWGACDTAIDAERLGVDMLVTFGHSAWEY